MSYRTPAIAIAFAVCAVSAAAIFAQSPARQSALTRSRYLPQYTASGELKLPENSIWREWVFVGEPLTPNALNGGQAGFPEYHNVYIEPGSYDIYRKTGIFPDETIFFKELQTYLTAGRKPGWLTNRAFGAGLFPRRVQWRGCDCQGFEALCRHRGLGILQFQSSRAEGSDRQGQGKIGMRILPYRGRQERRGLDAVLPDTGRGPPSSGCQKGMNPTRLHSSCNRRQSRGGTEL